MYSILVNPTHAVTGALAPSSPFLRVYFLILPRFNILFFLFIPYSPLAFALAIGPFILLILHPRCLTSMDPQGLTPPSRLPSGSWAPSFPYQSRPPPQSLLLPFSSPSSALHNPELLLQPASDFHLWNPLSLSYVDG